MAQSDHTLTNWTFNRKRWDGRVSMQVWTTYTYCLWWYSSLQVTHIHAKLWNSCCYIQRKNAEERVKVCLVHILCWSFTSTLTLIDNFSTYIDAYTRKLYPQTIPHRRASQTWRTVLSCHFLSFPSSISLGFVGIDCVFLHSSYSLSLKCALMRMNLESRGTIYESGCWCFL